MELNTEPKGNQDRSPIKKLSMLLVFLLLLAGGMYGVYYWQNSKVSQLDVKVADLQSQTTSLAQQKTTLEAENRSLKENQGEVLNEEEQILASLKNYCNAQLNPNSDPLGFRLHYADPPTNKVKAMYANKRSFARVNGACYDTSQSSASGARGGTVFTLKNVNKGWLVVHEGQSLGDEIAKLYGIPNSFPER